MEREPGFWLIICLGVVIGVVAKGIFAETTLRIPCSSSFGDYNSEHLHGKGLELFLDYFWVQLPIVVGTLTSISSCM